MNPLFRPPYIGAPPYYPSTLQPSKAETTADAGPLVTNGWVVLVAVVVAWL